MSLRSSVLDRLPTYIPKSAIRIDEDHTFDARESSDRDPKTVYQLDKAPIERLDGVEGIIDGVSRELKIGSEVEARDTNGDGEIDSIAFIDQDTHPDDGTTFTVYYVCEPIITRYVDAFDNDFETLGDRISGSIMAKQVDNASGRELDRIGAQFGEIGRRAGRGDAEYQAFLRSIVRAFNANGTKDGLRFAVASALRTDPENIVIKEEFARMGFAIEVENVTQSVMTATLQDLIEMARPSGVELLRPPVLGIGGFETGIHAGDTNEQSRFDGLGAQTIGNDTIG